MGNYRMTSNEGYWHQSQRGEPSSVYYCSEHELPPEGHFGPFGTWERARSDAIAFHKDEILLSKSNISLLRAMNEPK